MNLDDLFRMIERKVAEELLKARAAEIADELRKRPQHSGEPLRTRETDLRIEVAKLQHGQRFVVADIFMRAKHASDLKSDIDARAALAATLMGIVEQFSPIPEGGRVEFTLDGRVSRFGGDEITEDIAIDMAEELLGSPSSRPKQ